MEPNNLVEGELYVFSARPRDRTPSAYRRQYAGMPAIYVGFEPERMQHFGETYEAYKLLINGEIHYVPEEALKFLELPDV